MFDLHTHSLHSDGELLPAELIQRAKMAGYRAIAITDHVDFSNIEKVMDALKKVEAEDIELLRGVELTHISPEKIDKLVRKASQLGAEIIVVHGETVAEPVANGTNRVAARNEDVDIIVHPGLIDMEDAISARENGIYLEITSRKGHSLSNGWVLKVAEKSGAKIIFSTDAHSPEDLLQLELAHKIVRGSGMDEKSAKILLERTPLEFLKIKIKT
jgi:histidinol phosphatase-like PHP family hydrolase